MRQIERRTIKRLKDAGAQTGTAAIPLEEHGIVADFVHRRLQQAGALHTIANDRYYLNQARYDAFRRRRRKRAALVILLLLAGMTALYVRGDISL